MGPLQLILDATIKEGHEAEFEAAANELTPIVEKEPGTLDWRWTREPGTAHVRFFDLYADAEAFVAHFQHARQEGVLDTLMSCVEMGPCQVVGALTPEAKQILDGFNATYHDVVGGFTRIAPLRQAEATH